MNSKRLFVASSQPDGASNQKIAQASSMLDKGDDKRPQQRGRCSRKRLVFMSGRATKNLALDSSSVLIVLVEFVCPSSRHQLVQVLNFNIKL